jgi:hypothetical protein
MANVRMLPPADGLRPSFTVPGTLRSYTAALGAFVDAPDFDALVLRSNGWTQMAGSVGTTAQRPAAPARGVSYFDTTLAVTIHFDGLVWRATSSGTAV